jgi:hypothetical protein
MEDGLLQIFFFFFFLLLAAFFVVFFSYVVKMQQFQPGQQGQEREKTVVLPPFWASRPAAWFAFAESKFRQKAVDSQRKMFDLLLAALPEKVLDQVMDVVANIPEDFPYDTLKARLLETHTLSDLEKLDVLFRTEPLGGRKPSQLLATMLASCPAGQEQTVMFQYMFLQRLPCTLRTLLGEQDAGDIRSLAARADKLWSTHKQQSHDMVANVEAAEEEQLSPQVAAVQKKEQRKRRPAWKKSGGGGKQTAPSNLTHSEQARAGSGICFSHWTWGAKATKCEAPCSWTGN